MSYFGRTPSPGEYENAYGKGSRDLERRLINNDQNVYGKGTGSTATNIDESSGSVTTKFSKPPIVSKPVSVPKGTSTTSSTATSPLAKKTAKTDGRPKHQIAWEKDRGHLGNADKQGYMQSLGYGFTKDGWRKGAEHEPPSAGAKIPDDILNNPIFQQLDQESQDIIKYYWDTLASEDIEKANAFNEALDIAVEQADPFWRQKLLIMKDDVERTLGTLESDLVSREKTLKDRKQAIEDDLTSDTGFLSLEEQASLSRLSDSYDVEIEGLRENMAARGLSSSTIRSKAEDRSETAHSGVVESVERRADKQERDLTATADRDVQITLDDLSDFQRHTKEAKTTSIRNLESIIGSEAAGKIDGASEFLLGDIVGSQLGDKASDILERAKALMSVETSL